ncbi:MAG: hypothetical protein R3D02_03800 [Hyphomicrobiales bacterium]
MTEAPSALTPFTRPIADLVARNGGTGGFLVVLPDYRPELLHGIARAIGAEFVDFRAGVMAAHGMNAGKLPLSTIGDWLADETTRRSLVLQNVEALLSTKSAEERAAWCRGFLEAPLPRPAIIPLVLFGAAAPEGHARVHRVAEADMPEETLLMRLWSSR